MSNRRGSHSCFVLRWWTERRTNRAERQSIHPFTTWKLPVKWGSWENKLIIFLLSVVFQRTWTFGFANMHHSSYISGSKHKARTHNTTCLFFFFFKLLKVSEWNGKCCICRGMLLFPGFHWQLRYIVIAKKAGSQTHSSLLCLYSAKICH